MWEAARGACPWCKFLFQYWTEPWCGHISSVWTNTKLLESASVSLFSYYTLSSPISWTKPAQGSLIYLKVTLPSCSYKSFFPLRNLGFSLWNYRFVWVFFFLSLPSTALTECLRLIWGYKCRSLSVKKTPHKSPRANTSIWFSAEQVNQHWSLKASIILWFCKVNIQHSIWTGY